MNVYRICFPNGKQYVGIESRTGMRKSNHLAENGKQLVSKAIRKYGSENVYFEYLFSDLTEEDALFIEKELIATWELTDPKFGYNLAEGGSRGPVGYKWTPEQRERRREEQKRRPVYPHVLENLPKMGAASAIRRRKPILAIHRATGNLIAFPSIRHASDALGVQNANIYAVLNGKQKQTGGWQFERLAS